MMKRAVIIFTLLAVMAVSVGVIYAQGPEDEQGRGHHRRGGQLIETIAEALDMEPEAVIDALRAEEGTTLADVIEANDGDVDAIIATLVDEKTDRINQAVEDGRLTQEEADERIAELEGRITERLNGEFTGRGPENGRRGPRGPRGDDAPEAPETGDNQSTSA